MNILNELAKPFPPERVHWRVGARNKDKTKGIALAYIDARDVMERLDMVVGGGNWQDRYPFSGCCEIGIAADVLGWETRAIGNDPFIWKANGAGQTDVEGEKGQYSDAFKRAAVMWGIGRYLYSLPNTWYELTGNNYDPFKTKPKLPDWATPGGWNRIPLDVRRRVYNQVTGFLAEGDELGMKQVMGEFDTDEKAQLWGMFDSRQRSTIKELMK